MIHHSVGNKAGVAWIQSEGATDCTDAEVSEYASDLAGFSCDTAEDRAAFMAGFVAGARSMTVQP